MSVTTVGDICVIWAIPEWLAAALGVDSKLVQCVDMNFSNTDFATATITLLPEAEDALKEKFEGATFLMIQKPKVEAEVLIDELSQLHAKPGLPLPRIAAPVKKTAKKEIDA